MLLKSTSQTHMPRMLCDGWAMLTGKSRWLALPQYPEAVTSLGRITAGPIIQKSLNRQLKERVQRRHGVAGSDINAVVKALKLQKGTIQNQMIVYANEKDPEIFNESFVMQISSILCSPVYELPVCVPEIVMSILMDGCGRNFTDSVRFHMSSSNYKEYYTSGKLFG